MKLEKQVTSLELSKKLKELGVKQESLFYWVSHFNGDELVFENDEHNFYKSVWKERSSAYTVAELGEMLPRGLCTQKAPETYHMQFDSDAWKDAWNIKGLELGFRELWEETKADTEADARAKCLIYLIENDLTTL